MIAAGTALSVELWVCYPGTLSMLRPIAVTCFGAVGSYPLTAFLAAPPAASNRPWLKPDAQLLVNLWTDDAFLWHYILLPEHNTGMRGILCQSHCTNTYDLRMSRAYRGCPWRASWPPCCCCCLHVIILPGRAVPLNRYIELQL